MVHWKGTQSQMSSHRSGDTPDMVNICDIKADSCWTEHPCFTSCGRFHYILRSTQDKLFMTLHQAEVKNMYIYLFRHLQSLLQFAIYYWNWCPIFVSPTATLPSNPHKPPKHHSTAFERLAPTLYSGSSIRHYKVNFQKWNNGSDVRRAVVLKLPDIVTLEFSSSCCRDHPSTIKLFFFSFSFIFMS